MSELVRYRFSVEEYHLMGEAGLFDEDDRVELLDGEVVEMAPIGSRHAAIVKWINNWLNRQLGGQAIVGVQDPMWLSEFSEPQPDLTVLRLRADYYAAGHPTPGDVLVVIEVADSTVGSDRRVKVPLYATAGVAEVWLVDLPARRLHCFRQPSPTGYRDVVTYAPGKVVALPDFPGLSLAVAELFDTVTG